jgi:hypothetical protein
MSEMVELVYRELKDELATLRVQVEKAQRVERAEIADSIPAYELADAPLAAQGGLGDGVSYITLAWISDGRKSGEGAGAGTGILAFYDSSSDTWKGVRSEVNVTT